MSAASLADAATPRVGASARLQLRDVSRERAPRRAERPSAAERMIGSHVHKGIYDVGEASRLLGIPRSRLDRWSGRTGTEPALVTPEHGDAFSFADIVTLSIIDELRLRDVPEDSARAAHEVLAHLIGTPSPFAHERLTAGWGAGPRPGGLDERTFLTWTLPIVRSLEHGPDGLAYLWRPTPCVWLNARVQAGAPCIDQTRIPTLLVAQLVGSGDHPEDVADDFGITKDQIDAALRFEQLLAR